MGRNGPLSEQSQRLEQAAVGVGRGRPDRRGRNVRIGSRDDGRNKDLQNNSQLSGGRVPPPGKSTTDRLRFQDGPGRDRHISRRRNRPRAARSRVPFPAGISRERKSLQGRAARRRRRLRFGTGRRRGRRDGPVARRKHPEGAGSGPGRLSEHGLLREGEGRGGTDRDSDFRLQRERDQYDVQRERVFEGGGSDDAAAIPRAGEGRRRPGKCDDAAAVACADEVSHDEKGEGRAQEKHLRANHDARRRRSRPRADYSERG
mmetsp:Transcript_41573/g.88575  ORF Transcript_41573/g.88575 Transcript_41573/m.88575 type:complete len:260 (-) Transcript_41573:150-929(-)